MKYPMTEKDIVFGGEKLTLTTQRAIYWSREDALILSDLHVGKAAHFRQNGIPISGEVLKKDLERLEIVLAYYSPKKLIVVGDLFHADMNEELILFRKWTDQFKDLHKILVKGNHDRVSNSISSLFSEWEIVNELTIKKITFVHEPKQSQKSTDFYISGHIHPGILIKGKGRQRFKLPCYQVLANQLILPAFSLFTGLDTNNKNDKIINYSFTENSFFEI